MRLKVKGAQGELRCVCVCFVSAREPHYEDDDDVDRPTQRGADTRRDGLKIRIFFSVFGMRKRRRNRQKLI